MCKKLEQEESSAEWETLSFCILLCIQNGLQKCKTMKLFGDFFMKLFRMFRLFRENSNFRGSKSTGWCWPQRCACSHASTDRRPPSSNPLPEASIGAPRGKTSETGWQNVSKTGWHPLSIWLCSLHQFCSPPGLATRSVVLLPALRRIPGSSQHQSSKNSCF